MQVLTVLSLKVDNEGWQVRDIESRNSVLNCTLIANNYYYRNEITFNSSFELFKFMILLAVTLGFARVIKLKKSSVGNNVLKICPVLDLRNLNTI